MGQTHGVINAMRPPMKPEMKIQNSDMPAVLPFIPKSWSSLVTGVQSRSLSIPSEETATGEMVCRLSVTCAGVKGMSGRLVSLVADGTGVFGADAFAVTVAGNCAAVKEKSFGRGGVQLLLSHA